MRVKVSTKYGEKFIDVGDVEEVEIVGDDGTLFAIRPTKEHDDNGAIEVSTNGGCVKHNGIVLDSTINITPYAGNVVYMGRAPYK